MPSSSFLSIILTLIIATCLTLVDSLAVLGPPSCESWTGRPAYADCILALGHFVTAVTIRGYGVDEIIEFRSPETPATYAESEVLVPDLNTFVSADVHGPMDGNMCVIAFSLSYPQIRTRSASFIASYRELAASALSVISQCTVGTNVPAYGHSGGTGSLTSNMPSEFGLRIIATVYQTAGFDPDVARLAQQSVYYRGEKLLGANPFDEDGPDFYGVDQVDGSDHPLQVEGMNQDETTTRPEEASYCNAKIKPSCWQGFRCDVLRLVDGVKSVLWGLEAGRTADFVGSCVVGSSGS